MKQFDIIAFDADDTLWHSEDQFSAGEQRFVAVSYTHLTLPTIYSV